MLLLLVLVSFCSAAGEPWYSDSLPDSNQTVLDPDHVLAPEIIAKLDQMLIFQDTIDGCLPEAKLIVVQSVRGDADTFCQKVHQRWSVGMTASGCNHGVTMAFVLSARQMYIWTGDGLSWRLPTLAKHRVMDSVVSQLQNDRVDEALLVSSSEMARYIRGEVQPVGDWIAMALIIFVLVVLCLLVAAAQNEKGGSSIWIFSSSSSSRSGWGSGSGSGRSW